jgi:hypothetical protein
MVDRSQVTPDLAAARTFILRTARLLDRRRFAHRFDGAPASCVVAALLPYQNPDGGFGNALEPDLRGADSQPVPAEHALQILDEVGDFDAATIGRACDWLTAVTTESGGLPFVLPSVAEAPHAPWWESTGEASLNPTAGIAGLLHKHGVDHPWLSTATEYCWNALQTSVDELGPDDTVSVLTFLEYVPDRSRAEAAFDLVGARIVRDLVALDPAATGYVKMPLEFAPHPGRLAARLFDESVIELHLDALASRQESDGGWPITWEPPSSAAVEEWRGFVTVKWLEVLGNYGRRPA